MRTHSPRPLSALALTLAFVATAGLAATGTGTGEEVEIATVWEVDGEAFCSYEPPPPSENGFQFNYPRWFSSATDSGPLYQGDPMTLTWSFLPDGAPQGGGFTCGVPGETAGAPSDLIAFLDGLHGSGPGGGDLTQRPWFTIFQQAFDNWGAMNGVHYVYEPADDGASAGSGGAPGVLGVRGDIRIGGHYIDGQSGPNVLACNYFPSNGDMIFDTGNSNFYSPNPPEHRGFRNVIEHEHGHGLAFSHVCPLNQTKLMEPFVSFAFLGAQEDDVLAANRGYGDRDEFPNQNDSPGTATSLGAVAVGGSATRLTLSIDDDGDDDYYSFSAPAATKATITVTPTGTTYLQGPQTPQCDTSGASSFNALAQNDLGVELLDLSGFGVLASRDDNPAGLPETISEEALDQGAGTYFVRVFGADNAAQMYDLALSLEADGADLEIDKTASVNPVFTGETLLYTIGVTNLGPGAATGVVVTDTLPSGVTLVSTTGCAEDPNGVPTCTLGSIAPLARKEYTVEVTVDAGPGSITNNAGVASTSADPDATNDQTSVETTVVAMPACAEDLALTAADSGSATGYAATNSITIGSGFSSSAVEAINFTAGVFVALDNDTTFAGEIALVSDPSVCP